MIGLHPFSVSVDFVAWDFVAGILQLGFCDLGFGGLGTLQPGAVGYIGATKCKIPTKMATFWLIFGALGIWEVRAIVIPKICSDFGYNCLMNMLYRKSL